MPRPKSLFDPPPPDSSRRILLSAIFNRLEKLQVAGRFVTTLRALRADPAIASWNDDELRKAGLLTPFRFNLYQSALSTAAAAIVIQTIQFLFLPDYSAPIAAHAESASLFVRRVSSLFGRLAPSAVSAAPPFALFLLASLAGVASLRHEHWRLPAIRRQLRAFFFFDGYYGLVPQFLYALILALSRLSREHPEFHALEAMLSLGFGLWSLPVIIAVLQLVVIGSLVPGALFSLAGYSSIVHLVPSLTEVDPRTPPRLQYFLLMNTVAPVLIAMLYFLLLAGTMIVAILGAMVQALATGTGFLGS